MSEPYVGEIRMFAGNFAPQDWALCNGQELNISEYETLYSLLGTTYGGDGVTTFKLPDLQGRVPIHPSTTYPLGAKAGTETVTLTTNQMPMHTHVPNATSVPGADPSPSNDVWANLLNNDYSDGVGQTPVSMNGTLLTTQGSNQPHENMMPTLTVSFIISLFGIYPTQN